MNSEITGVPCSGKSSIIYHLPAPPFNKSDYNSIIVIIKGFLYLGPKRLFFFLISSFREEATFSYRLRIFFNIIKKFGFFHIAKKNKSYFIFDEGVSHIPFNLLSTDTNTILDSIELELSQIYVYLLRSCDAIELRRRYEERGHPRLNYTKISDFVHRNALVEMVLIEKYPKLCYKFEVRD
ncbi:hypothetical protein AB6D89_20170 [Vibrio splendidus]